MKIRNGFVSNSSSSSFVVLKDSLTEEQQNQILNYQEWVKFFINLDEENYEKDNFASDKEKYAEGSPYWDQSQTRLKYKFEYYYEGYWRIIEFDDFIFGETGMDNFGMEDYFEYLKLDRDYYDFEEGWIDEPTPTQKGFIQQKKQEFRKRKLEKLNTKSK